MLSKDDKILFVTPATPGFYVVSTYYEDGAVHEAREPVIAWAVDASGFTLPATVHEVHGGTQNPAVLCPDGQVFDGFQTWTSLYDWLKKQREAARDGDLR